MELRQELVFKSSKGPKLELDIPDEDGPDKVTLGLKAVLNKTLATSLNVDWMFASETVAYPGMKDATLDSDVSFTDVELKLVGSDGELNTFYPERVYSWRVFAMSSGQLGVQCKISMEGHLDECLDFLRQHRSAEGFTFIIKSRQGELFEGGTRVDLSEQPKRGRGRPKKVQAISEPEPVEEAAEVEELSPFAEEEVLVH